MLKLICCAPGCIWSNEYPDDAPPERERGAGYTPLAKCPECQTPDATHYACDVTDCWERATGRKQWGWRCPEHRHDRG